MRQCQVGDLELFVSKCRIRRSSPVGIVTLLGLPASWPSRHGAAMGLHGPSWKQGGAVPIGAKISLEPGI